MFLKCFVLFVSLQLLNNKQEQKPKPKQNKTGKPSEYHNINIHRMWWIGLSFLPFLIWHAHRFKNHALIHEQNTTSLVMLSLLVCMVLVTEPFCDAFILTRLRDVENINPLDRVIYDIGHEILPFAPDMFTQFCNPMLLVCAIFMALDMYFDPQMIPHRLVTYFAVMFMRNCLIMTTQLPLALYDIRDNCMATVNDSYSALVSRAFTLVSCGDYFFSGHTIVYCMTYLSFLTSLRMEYFSTQSVAHRRLSRSLHVILVLSLATCLVGLISSQAHYTIDVLSSLFFTSTFFFSYSPMIVAKFYLMLKTDELSRS